MTIMKKILFTIFVFTFVSCSSNNDFQKGKEQLEQQGYTDVKNTGHQFFCCDEKDTFSTGFECKDKNGKIVKGCFCSKLLKGLTIRFE
jgi:hypothetical protein